MPLAAFRPSRDDVAALLRLAMPLVVVQVGQMSMGVVDSMLLGRVSGAAMAAGALGNLYSFAIALFAMGVLMILDPLISQAVGARDDDAESRHLQRGMVLATILTVPVALLHLPAESVMRAFGQKDDVVPGAAEFALASILGIAPFLYVTVMRQSLQARHSVRQIVIAIVVANVANVFFNWVFVFGHLGAPALGPGGSGIATSLSRWFLALVLAALAWPQLRPHLLPVRRDAFDVRALVRLCAMGAPIGFQISLEMGVFAVVGLLIGRIGSSELAGHQVAINLASLTFMVPLGVAMAASVRVGNAIGRGDMPDARRSAGAGLLCGGGFMVTSGVLFLTCARPLALLYNREPDVVATATALLGIASVFQVFDGLQCVATGVLRGAGETRVPAAANLVGYWVIGLPFGWWLVSSHGAGPAGLWWGLTLGLAAVAVLLTWRTFHVLAREVRRVETGDVRLGDAPRGERVAP